MGCRRHLRISLKLKRFSPGARGAEQNFGKALHPFAAVLLVVVVVVVVVVELKLQYSCISSGGIGLGIGVDLA